MEEDREEFELEEKHFFGVRYWLLSRSRLNSTFFKAPTPCQVRSNLEGIFRHSLPAKRLRGW